VRRPSSTCAADACAAVICAVRRVKRLSAIRKLLLILTVVKQIYINKYGMKYN
jgi:hypothetical protein